MRNLAIAATILGFLAVSTVARADIPKIGDPMPWPTVKKYWLGDPPNASDAAGKVVIHWFCSPKVATCKDDLARLTELRESNAKVYVIAYLSDSKSKRTAGKLDPIREDVGAGATAYGKEVDRLGATIGLPAGGSVVQDVDGKVQLVAPSTDPEFLDKRDAKVKELIEAIKEYTVAASGPNAVKLNESFDLKVSVSLAAWLTTSNKSPLEFALTAPSNVTCTKTKLAEKDVKMDAKIIEATFSCKATKAGSYETSASLRFGFENPTRATGVGSDSARWKFTVK
jgi:hypothetical protein